MNEKTKMALLKFYPPIMIIIAVTVVIGLSTLFPNADSALLLLEFEEEHFIGLDITEVDMIKSGDVEIRLDLQEFVDTSVSMDKQVYKYYSSGDLLTYVFFVEGRDGELVEYYVIIRFNESFDEWLEW